MAGTCLPATGSVPSIFGWPSLFALDSKSCIAVATFASWAWQTCGTAAEATHATVKMPITTFLNCMSFPSSLKNVAIPLQRIDRWSFSLEASADRQLKSLLTSEVSATNRHFSSDGESQRNLCTLRRWGQTPQSLLQKATPPPAPAHKRPLSGPHAAVVPLRRDRGGDSGR